MRVLAKEEKCEGNNDAAAAAADCAAAAAADFTVAGAWVAAAGTRLAAFKTRSSRAPSSSCKRFVGECVNPPPLPAPAPPIHPPRRPGPAAPFADRRGPHNRSPARQRIRRSRHATRDTSTDTSPRDTGWHNPTPPRRLPPCPEREWPSKNVQSSLSVNCPSLGAANGIPTSVSQRRDRFRLPVRVRRSIPARPRKWHRATTRTSADRSHRRSD